MLPPFSKLNEFDGKEPYIMDKIKGANLGNWLVLEKWMEPDLFEDIGVEDET